MTGSATSNSALVCPVDPQRPDISVQASPRTYDSGGSQGAASSTRYQSLDLWRGFACLLIVMYHSMSDVYWQHLDESIRSSLPADLMFRAVLRMWVGVPMFFVISGYCIAATADSTRRKGHSAREYFWRRFRRIFPPYWICFALYAVLIGMVDVFLLPGLFLPMDTHFWSFGLASLVGNISLTEIWLRHFHGGAGHLFLGQAWTLCYEEQFYAVVGIAFFAWPRRFFTSMALISLAVLAFCLGGNHQAVNGFFFDGQWLLFAAGILLYFQVNYATRAQSHALRAVLVAGLLWAFWDQCAAGSEEEIWAGRRLAAFGFALLLSLLHRFDARLAASRLLRPVALCGTMCYSLYLTHSALVKAIRNGAAHLGIGGYSYALLVPLGGLGVSLLVGTIFYFLVERRFLNTPCSRR